MALFKFLAAARRALPRLVPLFRHEAVPFWLKAATVALGLLIISPIDLFGDIPVLGVCDDVVLLALLLNIFVAVAGRYAAQPVGRYADVPMNRARPAAYRLNP
ncbi:MAG: hypothetical protein JO043_08675 [Candidatus Eremiobacteraeota bacterium]|nr:hypothetical protein [Candidatus Eremiobacteraeota bacterium]